MFLRSTSYTPDEVGEKRGLDVDTDEKPMHNKKTFVSTTQQMSESDRLADNAQSMIDEMDEKRKQDGALVTGRSTLV